ncbi:MAG TPA: hypothetical protein VE954_42690 [Oligoflexus sp.]|uniref:hypothetical protein n=1 Tax=Oligoflexus sp. TaxID=1971216 RepID=UPI002D50F25E|nr:hypothetical protein [Oligoflexus sp.]HYX39850.1 hypothetical protein [Oligoflexus sp.]
MKLWKLLGSCFQAVADPQLPDALLQSSLNGFDQFIALEWFYHKVSYPIMERS